MFRQELLEIAAREVLRRDEPQLHRVVAFAARLDQLFDSDLSDAAGGEGACRAVEREIDADGALRVDGGPGVALIGEHQVDDLLVVPEVLGLGRGLTGR